MAALKPLYILMNIDISKFSKQELPYLEAELFARIYDELTQSFKEKFKHFYALINTPNERTNKMVEINLTELLIKDILVTEDYTMNGIALYTGTDQDVIIDIILGRNKTPSALFLRRIIELHRLTKPDFYHKLIDKLIIRDNNT